MTIDYFYVSNQFTFMLGLRNNSLWNLPLVTSPTAFIAQFPTSGFPSSYPNWAISFEAGNSLRNPAKNAPPIMTYDIFGNVVVLGISLPDPVTGVTTPFLTIVNAATGQIGTPIAFTGGATPRQCGAITSSIAGEVFWACQYKQNLLTYNIMSEYNRCDVCPAGTYSNGTSCRPCPSGTFGVNSGATDVSQCSPCPTGTWSQATGLNSSALCIPCMSGYYNNQTGSTSASTCIACPAGTQSLIPGASSLANCQYCTLGYYSNQGSSRCTQCPYRTISTANFTGCTSCPEVSMHIIMIHTLKEYLCLQRSLLTL
jgi:hypothetical protein